MGGLVEAVAEHRGREGGTKQAVEPWAGRERKRRGREEEEKRKRRGREEEEEGRVSMLYTAIV